MTFKKEYFFLSLAWKDKTEIKKKKDILSLLDYHDLKLVQLHG